MEKLPLKEIVFKTGVDGTGVFAMSIVKDPAIKKTYVYFSEHKPLKFAIQSEEKRIIFAPALIPDMEVYREMNGEKFNLTVSRETIENIAVDFLKNNRANLVNLEHKEAAGKPAVINGVTMFQFLLTDEHTCKSVVGYEDLPVGTWFIGAKVNNNEVWQGVKDGTFTGWSIHAVFDAKPITQSTNLSEVKVANDNSIFIDGEIAVGNYVYSNRPQISLINGIKSEIKSLVWENQITLEGGTVLQLADGKIIEITKPNNTTLSTLKTNEVESIVRKLITKH